jgi:hypothetical protein
MSVEETVQRRKLLVESGGVFLLLSSGHFRSCMCVACKWGNREEPGTKSGSDGGRGDTSDAEEGARECGTNRSHD